MEGSSLWVALAPAPTPSRGASRQAFRTPLYGRTGRKVWQLRDNGSPDPERDRCAWISQWTRSGALFDVVECVVRSTCSQDHKVEAPCVRVCRNYGLSVDVQQV